MKKITRIISFSAILMFSFMATSVFAQTDPHAAMHATVSKATANRILDKALTDTGLVNKKLRVTEYNFPPGYTDTIAHRHGAEVFIYVIEGSMEYRLGKNEPIIYKAGQILHEPPYSLHTLTKNSSTTDPLKVIIMFLYTDGPGAPLYLREYPPVKKQ